MVNPAEDHNDIDTTGLGPAGDLGSGAISQLRSDERRLNLTGERERMDKEKILSLEGDIRKLTLELEREKKEGAADPLTGLKLYKKTQPELAEVITICERQGIPLSVAVLDLDHFKQTNDTYGHQAGDRVLKAFASAIKDSVREADIEFRKPSDGEIESTGTRWGGEEFVIVLVGSTPEDAAEKVMPKILAKYKENLLKLEETYELPKGLSQELTFSAGVTNFVYNTPGGDSLEQAFARADQNLYEAKKNRNSVATSSSFSDPHGISTRNLKSLAIS